MTMGQKGFSLVELLTVIAIMIVLTSIATLQFSSMVRKREIEKQTQLLYTDLAEVRQKALYEKTQRMVRLTGSEFTVYPGTSTAAAPVIRRTLNYPVVLSNGDAAIDIRFDTFGISDNSTLFVCVDPASSSVAPVNSLRITATGVDLAQRKEGTCSDANISLK